MKILSIFAYPIKSMGSVILDSCKVKFTGIQYDRQWMLIDSESNIFLSQREIPLMKHFKCRLSNTHLLVTSPKGRTIGIDLYRNNENHYSAHIWDSKVSVYGVSELVDQWFSEELERSVKLVRHINDSNRKRYIDKLKDNIELHFADGYPFMFIGSKSLEDINHRVNQNIASSRFRPNLIIETNEAYEEEKWDLIKIGNLSFKMVKPCQRCIMVNIDPDSLEIQKEPLRTLSTYKKIDNKINFGINIISLNEGRLSIGDAVKVSQS